MIITFSESHSCHDTITVGGDKASTQCSRNNGHAQLEHEDKQGPGVRGRPLILYNSLLQLKYNT